MTDVLELIRGLEPETLTNRQVLFAYLRFMVREMLAGMNALPEGSFTRHDANDYGSRPVALELRIPTHYDAIRELHVSDYESGKIVTAEFHLGPTEPHIYINQGAGPTYLSVIPGCATSYMYGTPANKNLPRKTGMTYGHVLPDKERTSENLQAIADAYAGADPPRTVPPAKNIDDAFDQSRTMLASTVHDQIRSVANYWAEQMGIETIESFRNRIIDVLIDNDM